MAELIYGNGCLGLADDSFAPNDTRFLHNCNNVTIKGGNLIFERSLYDAFDEPFVADSLHATLLGFYDYVFFKGTIAQINPKYKNPPLQDIYIETPNHSSYPEKKYLTIKMIPNKEKDQPQHANKHRRIICYDNYNAINVNYSVLLSAFNKHLDYYYIYGTISETKEKQKSIGYPFDAMSNGQVNSNCDYYVNEVNGNNYANYVHIMNFCQVNNNYLLCGDYVGEVVGDKFYYYPDIKVRKGVNKLIDNRIYSFNGQDLKVYFLPPTLLNTKIESKTFICNQQPKNEQCIILENNIIYFANDNGFYELPLIEDKVSRLNKLNNHYSFTKPFYLYVLDNRINIYLKKGEALMVNGITEYNGERMAILTKRSLLQNKNIFDFYKLKGESVPSDVKDYYIFDFNKDKHFNTILLRNDLMVHPSKIRVFPKINSKFIMGYFNKDYKINDQQGERLFRNTARFGIEMINKLNYRDYITSPYTLSQTEFYEHNELSKVSFLKSINENLNTNENNIIGGYLLMEDYEHTAVFNKYSLWFDRIKEKFIFEIEEQSNPLTQMQKRRLLLSLMQKELRDLLRRGAKMVYINHQYYFAIFVPTVYTYASYRNIFTDKTNNYRIKSITYDKRSTVSLLTNNHFNNYFTNKKEYNKYLNDKASEALGEMVDNEMHTDYINIVNVNELYITEIDTHMLENNQRPSYVKLEIEQTEKKKWSKW